MFAVSQNRLGRLWTYPRRCGERSSSGSFAFQLLLQFPLYLSLHGSLGFALEDWLLFCVVVTDTIIVGTVLRFSKAAIGGAMDSAGFLSGFSCFTGVSFQS